jgi:2-hydroxychromene-2-carboxylate isomerase
MIATTIEFWFEFASTYSYPAAMRVDDVAGQYGAVVVWRPFLLGPIFRNQGWPDSPFNIYPIKGRYMWRDLERTCAGLRIPFQRPSQFPRNGLHAARIACSGGGASWVPEFVRRVYTANFAKDLDVADVGVLLQCLNGLVADPKVTLANAGDEIAKSRLRQNTDRAIQLGIFGAPTFVVDDELFWGNDRLEAALEWCRSGSQAG